MQVRSTGNLNHAIAVFPVREEGEPEGRSRSKLEFPEAAGPRPAAGKLPPRATPLRRKNSTRCYSQLGLALEQANQQVLAYLIERHSQAAGGAAGTLGEKLDALAGKVDRLSGGIPLPPPTAGTAPPVADAAAKGALQSVQEKLDQLDAKFKALSEKAAAIDALKEAFIPTLVKVRDGLSEQHAALGGGIRQVQQQFDEGLRALGAMLPAGRRPLPAAPGSRLRRAPLSGDWQEAILGRDLAETSRTGSPTAAIALRLPPGRAGGLRLVGQLLVFRSSPAEKMPTLLKEIGEAYYRWSPQTGGRADEMENALVAWLQRACEQAGISNTIELVHPGERFDSTRHNAAERGVEITKSFGWIVLRDNGKVYTKASVAVK